MVQFCWRWLPEEEYTSTLYLLFNNRSRTICMNPLTPQKQWQQQPVPSKRGKEKHFAKPNPHLRQDTLAQQACHNILWPQKPHPRHARYSTPAAERCPLPLETTLFHDNPRGMYLPFKESQNILILVACQSPIIWTKSCLGALICKSFPRMRTLWMWVFLVNTYQSRKRQSRHWLFPHPQLPPHLRLVLRLSCLVIELVLSSLFICVQQLVKQFTRNFLREASLLLQKCGGKCWIQGWIIWRRMSKINWEKYF